MLLSLSSSLYNRNTTAIPTKNIDMEARILKVVQNTTLAPDLVSYRIHIILF